MTRMAVTAHLDIKPGSCPNPINVDDPGDSLMFIDGAMVSVIPMSVLGNKFDVEQVDVGTVTLNRPGSLDGISVSPIQITFSDTGTPFEGIPCDCHDLTGDKLLDLDLKFDKQQVIDAFGLSEEPDGSFIELRVSGLIEGELEFTSKDCIRIINH